MKILMIAPEPVFRLRGTPFSIRDRCRALSDLGHTVDLLTYPFGDDFVFPNVAIHRTRRIPLIKDVKIGFSFAKIPLDACLFVKAFRALKRASYDLIHTHEEAGMMGAILSRKFNLPHLYDMHSSLPQQFENYNTLNVKSVMNMMRRFEKYILKHSQGIIAICPHLKEIALKAVPDANVAVIENLAQMEGEIPSPEEIRSFKSKMGLEDGFVVGYTGTFEINQGLELLIDAFAKFHNRIPSSCLYLVGGTGEQIENIKNLSQKAGILNACRIPGKLPRAQMGVVMASCDVLVSPRIIGTNTPLKLYSYLKSGVPILATDLLTHTQVLDRSVAVLTEVSPEAVCNGLLELYANPDKRKDLAAAAREREEKYYSYPAYKEKLAALIEGIFNMEGDHESRAS
ncbi:glycosyltransferase family 4 protein [bacterium]|nr:glycosyltransferase family 4 protein [candidate division CSSED10-310 bacterium]